MNVIMAICLLVILFAVALWDVYAYIVLTPGDSVSCILNLWGSQFPPFLVAIGVVIGHLFWPLRLPGITVPEIKIK